MDVQNQDCFSPAGEWTTIQVSKKGKKQKPDNKKDSGLSELALETENEPEIPAPSASDTISATSSADANKAEEANTPQAVKNKKNKEKLLDKVRITDFLFFFMSQLMSGQTDKSTALKIIHVDKLFGL